MSQFGLKWHLDHVHYFSFKDSDYFTGMTNAQIFDMYIKLHEDDHNRIVTGNINNLPDELQKHILGQQ